MPAPRFTRRTMLGAIALPFIAGCGTPLPLMPAPATAADAVARVRESAEVHGLSTYLQLSDINVSYTGQWHALVGRIQPELVDSDYRGSSEERLIPKAHLSGQAYTGPKGTKYVRWQRGSGAGDDLGSVAVWQNDKPSRDPAVLQTAALVAEGYGLFLLGPMVLVDRGLPMRILGTETVDGRLCDVVEVWLMPGLGRVARDQVALCIDRSDSITRRIRFTLEGFTNTQGAVAEVDTYDHERRFGVLWPMRSFERVRYPIPLAAHDWRMTGLDVNRGYPIEALAGPEFTGGALPAAQPL